MLQRIHRSQLALDEAKLRRPVGALAEPVDEVDDRDSADEHEPKPKDDEDLLVEYVNRQHALQRVGVHVGELSDLEVAQRHVREVLRGDPLLAVDEVAHDAHAEHVVFVAENHVQREQLADGVGGV